MDAFIETLTMPVMAGALLALGAIGTALVAGRGHRWLGSAVFGVAVLLALAAAWMLSDAREARQRLGERQALERRMEELARRAAEPGSPAACLNGLAGSAVEQACAALLFASPLTVARAADHAAAQLALLAEAAHAVRRGVMLDAGALAALRRAAENDAFGLYSQVLAQRDGCTPEVCAAFSLLGDASRLRRHMAEAVFAAHVARHAGRWGEPPGEDRVGVSRGQAPAAAERPADAPVSAPVAPPAAAVASPAPPVAVDATGAAAWASAGLQALVPLPPPRPAGAEPPAPLDPTGPGDAAAEAATRAVPPAASVLRHLDFPSASSIPAISIMRPEPRLPSREAGPAPESDPAPSHRPAAPAPRATP